MSNIQISSQAQDHLDAIVGLEAWWKANRENVKALEYYAVEWDLEFEVRSWDKRADVLAFAVESSIEQRQESYCWKLAQALGVDFDAAREVIAAAL